MNFEVLKRSHVKRNILIAIVIIFVLSAVILTFTQAKYRVTESIPLIQGTINFSPSDLDLMAVYLNKNGETLSSDKVPHVGYTLNTEQSICEVNDVEDLETEIVYENGYLYVNKLSHKGTKCTAYFDLIPDSEKPVINTINSSGDDTSISIIVDATDNIGIYYYYYKLDNEDEIRIEENSYTFEGLEKNSVHTITVRVADAAGNVSSDSKEVTVGYKVGDVILAASPTQGETTDWTGGTSYYYTGKPNNWLSFAGFYWRIIRINGDGTIRMIYQGTSVNTTGSGTEIGTSAFNSSDDKSYYVGLVYKENEQHGYGTNSTIMTSLVNWYNNNLVGYENDYIDTGTGFCSDRNLQSGSWDNWHDYASSGRMANNLPSLQCNEMDILTQDNGKLSNPIGLITTDEAMLGGIPVNGNGSNSYLYTGRDYWTMSPNNFDNSYGTAYNRVINQYGLYQAYVGGKWGVRPVINLRADVELTGSGTTSDPFKVVGAS